MDEVTKSQCKGTHDKVNEIVVGMLAIYLNAISWSPIFKIIK